MKISSFLTVLALAVATQQINAQGTAQIENRGIFDSGLIGFRAMPTVSSFEIQNLDGVVESDFTLGYGFGGLLGANFNRHLGLQLEFQYNTLSQKYADHSLDRRIDINYINVPLLLSLNTNRRAIINLNGVIGPQMGINVGSKLTTTGTNTHETNYNAILAVKQNDFGFAYGFGLDIGLNSRRSTRLDIGFRGVQGLVNISDQSEPIDDGSHYVLKKSNLKTYSVYAGLTFLLF